MMKPKNSNNGTRTARICLGIECGGTRSVAVLGDETGQCLRRIEGGPANIRLTSDSQLHALLAYFASQFPSPDAVGIGMSGVIDLIDAQRLRKAIEHVWPNVPAWVGNDLETAYAVVSGAGSETRVARIIVISGTGSSCYGERSNGESVLVGGWGHLLGDRGSGYDISMRAMQAAMRSFDLTGRWPALGQQLLRILQLNQASDLVAWAQNASKAEIAALAPEVFALSSTGDKLSNRVLSEAVSALAKDAVTCARRVSPKSKSAQFFLTGSALVRQPEYEAALKGAIQKKLPGSTVAQLEQESVRGALAKAWDTLAKSDTHTEARLNRLKSRVPVNSIESEFPIPASRGLSPTEQRNPRSMNLDQLSTASAIELMLREESGVSAALLRERAGIEKAVELISKALQRGGRLFYVGAGTSGRLGMLDASECPPTFGVSPELVQAIMAGGQQALWDSNIDAEDDAGAGAKAVAFRGVRRGDVVVGIAASGRTPFVWGALHAAKKLGVKTILISLNPLLEFTPATRPTIVIAPETGPEVLTGSTRLKAGTATKILLNMLTTLSMVQLGKVDQNLMIGVNPTNIKMRDRAVRIVQELTGGDREAVARVLARNEWVVKSALKQLR